jgi:protein transport protein SEC61 subunit alpha
MGKVNILRGLKPILNLLPEVEKPAKTKRISFKDKAIMTGVVLLIYLICCQIPLFGVNVNATGDPFYWMRAILASNRGSLMELGISPIVTSGMII